MTASVREIAHRSLMYDPLSGVISWRLTCSSSAPAGSPAGSKDRNGYIRVSLGGRKYLAHRLAWMLAHGDWPHGQIDHINGLRTDNRIANLRDVSASENQQNRHRAQGANRFPWVSWKRAERRWRAAFNVAGRTITVGHFDTEKAAFDAAVARRVSMGLPVPLIGTDGAPEVPAQAEVARDAAPAAAGG